MRDPGRSVTRRRLLHAGGGALLAGLAGCTAGGGGNAESEPTPTATPKAATETASATASPTPTPTSWRETELLDVSTGDQFTVSQFDERPVLLEFFAVWCPVCTKQQVELKKAIAESDGFVAISINTDPNESATRVQEHLERFDGFDWRFAVAPAAMTRALIDEFGSVIANPPAAPVVKQCPDGSASLLEGSGVKPAADLLAAVEQC